MEAGKVPQVPAGFLKQALPLSDSEPLQDSPQIPHPPPPAMSPEDRIHVLKV